jgi:hypothetical protein
MTIRFVKNLCAVSLLAAVSAVSAVAQSKTLQVNIPFAFVVNGVKLNAGSYWIQKADEAGTLMVHGASQSAVVLTNSTGDYNNRSEVPGLSFERNAEGEPVLTKVQFLSEPGRSIVVHSVASATSKTVAAGK